MMTEEQRLINEALKKSRDYLTEQAEFTVERLKEYDKCSERMFALMALEYMRLAALTQPASPALKLPDPFDANDAKMFCAAYGVKGAYELASQMANYAVDKVVRLNAPHTAPIEPICATGGAEWVSNERVEEIIYRAEMFGHGAGYLPDEVIPMAKELLALREAFTQPIVWIHQTTGAKLNNSVIEDVRKQSGAWIPLYRKPNLPL